MVREFKEDYILPKDSPTVVIGAMPMILAIESSMKWIIKLQISSQHELDHDV